MKNAQALAHIRQLSCLGVAGEAVMPALLKAVREYVGADSAAFFWVDARGEMTNLHAERVLPAPLMKLYFERHYDGPDLSFREAFRARARASEQVIASTADRSLERTSYYNEILRHLDAHHILYAVIRDQAGALGQLSLYRPKQAASFTAGERAALNDIRRYVAHAVGRQSTTSEVGGAGFLDTEDEGLVLSDQAGRVVQASTQSLMLLSKAADAVLSRSSPPLAAGDALPAFAAALVADLVSVLRVGAGAPPANIRDTRWGRFSVRAYLLSDNPADERGLVGLQIRRMESMIVKLAQAMHHLDLSPQQREVALLLAQGHSNPEIATSLNVSRNTAIYHIKQLFARLDAHDRGEALQRILAAHHVAPAPSGAG